MICTNDSHYIDQQDWEPHDVLLCVNTGELKSVPVGDGPGYRFGFPNDKFFFKTQAEMNELFCLVSSSARRSTESRSAWSINKGFSASPPWG